MIHSSRSFGGTAFDSVVIAVPVISSSSKARIPMLSKNTVFPILLLLFTLVIHSCSPGQQENPLKQVSWIIGTWAYDNPPRTIYESWSWNGEQELLAKSYRLEGTDTVLLERVQLVATEEGIFFRPTVENQNEGETITFTLNTMTENGWMFENLQHDFPQLIAYRRVGEDSLVATISGVVDEELRKRTFGMRRVDRHSAQ